MLRVDEQVALAGGVTSPAAVRTATPGALPLLAGAFSSWFLGFPPSCRHSPAGSAVQALHQKIAPQL